MATISLKLSAFEFDGSRPPKTSWYVKGDNFGLNGWGSNTGIGNYLFQISSTLSLAWKNNTDLTVPALETWCNKENENIDIKKTLWRHINTYKIKINSKNKELSYKPWGCYHGYFQNYNNFHTYKDKLLKIFGPNKDDLEYIYSKYKLLLDKKTCALHVRRGKDFKTIVEKWNPEFYIRNSYYKKSIDYMKDKVDLFLVFSDNQQYCKSEFNESNYPNITFKFIEERDYIDLWIMSLCNNYILSNSTFSWWGAYLNTEDENIVIAPEKSINLEKKDKKKRDKQLYFPDWIIMSE